MSADLSPGRRRLLWEFTNERLLSRCRPSEWIAKRLAQSSLRWRAMPSTGVALPARGPCGTSWTRTPAT